MTRPASFSFPSDPDREPSGHAFGPRRWSQIARAVGLAPDAPVLVALSGGADSVYLLHLVAASKPRPSLVAVHVDHGLRGDESDEDAAFCARLSASLGVPFVRRKLDLASEGGSLEARARAARYRVLCEEAVRAGAAAILTGHHADDALETLLQRWMRGTDVRGLPGLRQKLVLGGEPRSRMPANERLNETGAEIQVVRPLLAMRREEVRRVLADAGIRWREDSSNQSPRHVRNRVRNELLPAIEASCGPEAVENLRAFGAAVEGLEERCAELTAGLSWSPPLHAQARLSPAETDLGGTLPRRDLLAIPSPLRKRALWRLLAEGTGRTPPASVQDRLLEDLAAGRTTRHSLPGGFTLHLRSDLLHLVPPRGESLPAPMAGESDPQLLMPFAASTATDAARLELPGLVTLPDGRQITAEIVYLPRGTDVLRSADSVELEAADFVSEPSWAAPSLWVRLPRPGDRFHPLGAPGGKALSRFLADAGVPREDRDRVPLVFAGDELVWVAGIRPCESRRVRSDTEVRLRIRLHAPSLPERAKASRDADRLRSR
ncbi:MAG: tRNA lysidine(34) synthetase TilS [Planctomycetota bacterium]